MLSSSLYTKYQPNYISMSYQPVGSKECVVSCIKMVLSYYGLDKQITREELIDLLGVTENTGAHFCDAVNVLKHGFGFKAKEIYLFGKRNNKLISNIPSGPHIISVRNCVWFNNPESKNYHAVVLAGIKNNGALIHDPVGSDRPGTIGFNPLDATRGGKKLLHLDSLKVAMKDHKENAIIIEGRR